jgi:hypothetical protein
LGLFLLIDGSFEGVESDLGEEGVLLCFLPVPLR